MEQVRLLLIALVSVIISLLVVWHTQRAISSPSNTTNVPLAWHSIGGATDPATICLVFLTKAGIALPELWARWYEDARLTMADRGIEQLSPGARAAIRTCQAPPSAYLRSVVSWSPNDTNINLVKDNLPCWMHDSVMPNPAQGQWGSTNHVIHAALKYARERHPDADLYMVVSDTSIPVKPFANWHAEVTYDRRSRFYLWLMDFVDGIPKHAEWFGLSRSHLDILVDHPEEWLGKGSIEADPSEYVKGFASEEEYYPLRVILNHERLEIPSTPAERSEVAWLETVIKPYVQHTPDLSSFHWVHWYEIDRASRLEYLGSAEQLYSNRPYAFERINAGLLKYLHEREGVWMMRKVSKSTIVDHCEMNHMDYVTYWLTINEGDGYPYQVDIATRLRMRGDPSARMNSTCSVTDFLSRELHFKSAVPPYGVPEVGENWLYYGDRPYPSKPKHKRRSSKSNHPAKRKHK